MVRETGYYGEGIDYGVVTINNNIVYNNSYGFRAGWEMYSEGSAEIIVNLYRFFQNLVLQP